jgi:glycine/D-amino acid oxidase-like deaminating enzyme
MISRRGFVAASSSVLLAGCASSGGTLGTRRLSPPLQPRGLPIVLAPVAISDDRIIRRVVGLRPFRPSGFVVRTEVFGDKRVVHNYGHGGGGVTLSWGTGELALDQGFSPDVQRYAVLGCGAVGLACARLLQLRGAQVTIYAKDLPPDTTSNVAGAQWWPSFVFDDDAVTPAFQAQYVQAAHLANARFQTLVGARYGVRWTRNYGVSRHPLANDDPDPSPLALSDLDVESRVLSAEEAPFLGWSVRQFDTMMIEPPVYLSALIGDFRLAGGRIVVRELLGPADLQTIPEPVIFNCTGLGAKAIFGDPELIPVKGQLTVLLPQPEVTYNMVGDGVYMFPRPDGILLGGTEQRGVWSLAPDLEAETRILATQREIFAHMRS